MACLLDRIIRRVRVIPVKKVRKDKLSAKTVKRNVGNQNVLCCRYWYKVVYVI